MAVQPREAVNSGSPTPRNLSRREFLNLSLTSVFVAWLKSCAPELLAPSPTDVVPSPTRSVTTFIFPTVTPSSEFTPLTSRWQNWRQHGTEAALTETAAVTKEPPPTLAPPSPKEFPICLATHLDSSFLTAEDVDKQLDLIEQAGVKWVRFDFQKRILDERSEEYDFDRINEIVDKTLAKGIDIVGTLPQWGPLEGEYERVMSLEEYAEHVAKTAELFRGKIHVWEIGNEPDYPLFWRNPDVAEYTKYLKAAYTAIKEIDPDALVISGGITPENDPVQWLEDMYDNGAQGFFDAFGYHPYTLPGPPTEDNFRVMIELNQIMIDHGDTGIIYATEIGWSTADNEEGVSEITQAEYIAQLLDITKNDPKYAFLALTCIYKLMDGRDDEFGVVGPDGPKDAFEVIRQFTEGLNK